MQLLVSVKRRTKGSGGSVIIIVAYSYSAYSYIAEFEISTLCIVQFQISIKRIFQVFCKTASQIKLVKMSNSIGALPHTNPQRCVCAATELKEIKTSIWVHCVLSVLLWHGDDASRSPDPHRPTTDMSHACSVWMYAD
eukprot:g60090.t1